MLYNIPDFIADLQYYNKRFLLYFMSIQVNTHS